MALREFMSLVGVVPHDCRLSVGEAEIGGARVTWQSEIHSETLSQGTKQTDAKLKHHLLSVCSDTHRLFRDKPAGGILVVT